MADPVTSDSEPTLADILLQLNERATQSFEQDLTRLEAELSRFNSEIRALSLELEALRAAPGDHQKEIAEIEQKMLDKKQALDAVVGQAQARITTYQTTVDILTTTLSQYDKILEAVADKAGR
jgi:predicted  nucleic acid-binding Zn-ribbon protein